MISLQEEIKKIKQALSNYEVDNSISVFEDNLTLILSEFNNTYFPSPEFKYQLQRKKINEAKYTMEKEKDFLTIYNNLVKKYGILLHSNSNKNFLDKWYIPSIKKRN